MASPTLYFEGMIAAVLAAVIFFYYAQKKELLGNNSWLHLILAFFIFIIAISSIALINFFVEALRWLAVLGAILCFIILITLLNPKEAWEALDNKENIFRISTFVKIAIAGIVIYAISKGIGEFFLEAGEEGRSIALFKEGSIIANATAVGSSPLVLNIILFATISIIVFYMMIKKLI